MKLGILISSEPRGEVATGAQRLVDAAKKRGHDAERLYAPNFSFHQKGKNVDVRYEGGSFVGFDALIYRPNFVEEPSLHTHVPELLMRAGFRVLNGQANVMATKNKIEQHVRLSALGLPMPRWAIVKRKADAVQAARELGFPVVLKTPFGTHGVGIFYATDAETLQPIVDYLSISDGNPMIVESFIADANRKDLRAFILKGKVLAAMERAAPEGDIRANAALGGVGSATVLSEEEERLALQVAELFKCEVAGIDLLRSKSGPLFIEANANPGFTELERASGVDVAAALVDAALESR